MLNVLSAIVVGLVVGVLARFFYPGARIRDVNPETQSDHHRIVSVLRSRDPDAARQILIAHNEATRVGLLSGIASGRRMDALRVA